MYQSVASMTLNYPCPAPGRSTGSRGLKRCNIEPQYSGGNMRGDDNHDSIIVLRAEKEAERRRATTPYPKVSLIIPTLNEAENLKHVLPTIPNLVDELIIVDGASKDGTAEV